jgi:hypothetical protein
MTENRTYVGETGTQAFDGYAGLRIEKLYTGTISNDGTVLVSAVPPAEAGSRAAPVTASSPVTLKLEEWQKWFRA